MSPAELTILAVAVFWLVGVPCAVALHRLGPLPKRDEHDDYDPLTRRLLCDAEWDRILAAVESDEQAEYRAAGGWS